MLSVFCFLKQNKKNSFICHVLNEIRLFRVNLYLEGLYFINLDVSFIGSQLLNQERMRPVAEYAGYDQCLFQGFDAFALVIDKHPGCIDRLCAIYMPHIWPLLTIACVYKLYFLSYLLTLFL